MWASTWSHPVVTTGSFWPMIQTKSGSRRISTQPRRTAARCRVEAEIRTGEERDMDRRWVRLASGGWGAGPVCGSVGSAVPCVQTFGASSTQFIMWCSVPFVLPDTLPSAGHTSPSGPDPFHSPTTLIWLGSTRTLPFPVS